MYHMSSNQECRTRNGSFIIAIDTKTHNGQFLVAGDK